MATRSAVETGEIAISETPKFTVEHPKRNVHIITFDPVNASHGDVVGSMLLRSDAHHDSPECNRALEIEHLEQAREIGAVILDNGDVLDVMQSRNDPRREHGGKLPQHEKQNYLDIVVQEAADAYKPFAPFWAVMGRGNHETSLRRMLGTDLTERLVHEMRRDGNTQLGSCGYSGYIRLRFTISGSKFQKVLHRYHGSGGSSPVTRNAIKSHRMSREHPDADIVWTGHTHIADLTPWERWRFPRQNRIKKDFQWHVCTPGYKDGEQDGYEGFEVERLGNKPRAIGCAWVYFVWDRKNRTVRVKPELDIQTH